MVPHRLEELKDVVGTIKPHRFENDPINDRLEEYDGTTAVVRTGHMSADDVEFMRWKAERWMKARHMPFAFLHSPLFMLTNWPRMLLHTFRGSTFKSFVGIEDERRTFDRYRAIRKSERAYV